MLTVVSGDVDICQRDSALMCLSIAQQRSSDCLDYADVHGIAKRLKCSVPRIRQLVPVGKRLKPEALSSREKATFRPEYRHLRRRHCDERRAR